MVFWSCGSTALCAVLLAILVGPPVRGQETSSSQASFTASTWDEGQALFYSDPYWRGGDCASSIDLKDGRVLWLFADSYVGVKSPYSRDYCCVEMIRNCMGIQEGYDPSTARFNVYWRGSEEAPSAFFSSDDTSWYWPGNVVNAGSFLVVFLMHVCPSDVGLGFRECDQSAHAAYLVSDFEGVPREWMLTPLMLPDNPYGIMLGAATIIEPPYLYMFSIDVKEPGDRSMYLARWHTDSLLIGSTRAIEWWAHDSSAWVPDLELSSEPTTVFGDGATELSVIYDDKTKQYIAIQTIGFGVADVMMRTAPNITGPWSDLQLVYEPAEKSVPDVMIYAAKAHPEIVGADLIITYNTNGPIETIIADTTIYYPRFVRFNWRD